MHKTILLFFTLFCCAAIRAQPYAFIPYSLEEGLPQSQVFAALCDSRGYLWLGTQGGGATRFDGGSFETFAGNEGLPSNFVYALYEDVQRRTWMGTAQGFCWFDGQRIVRPKQQPGDGLAVYSFLERDAVTIWLGTEKGLYAYLPGLDSLFKIALNPALDNIPIHALFMGEQGLWLGTHRGAYRWEYGQVHAVTSNSLPANPVQSITSTSDGRLWMAWLGVGLVAVDAATGKVLEVRSTAGLDRPLCLFARPDGTLWAGTQQSGIFIIRTNPAPLLKGSRTLVRDTSYTHLTETDGLPHNQVRAITTDHAGHLWVATSGGGIARLADQTFRHFDRDDGLLGLRIYALLEDHAGRLWFTASQSGLQVLDSTGLSRSARDSGYLDGVKCKAIAEDHNGNLWVGSEGRGILVLTPDGKRRVLNRANGGLNADWIHKIVTDPHGDLWVATFGDGITRLTPRDSLMPAMKVYGLREGLPEVAITALAFDARGQLWFGTAGGWAGILKNGKVDKVFGREQGLPEAAVAALAFDAAGNCWLATKGEGLFVARPEAGFQSVSPARPLASKNLYSLVFDRMGNLWAGSEQGVDKLIFRREKEALADPVAAIETVAHFGKNEGFLGIETCQDAALCDRAGNLWFGTMNGLTKYVPTDNQVLPVPPTLQFQQITLFYKPLANTAYAAFTDPATGGLREGLELPWNQNHLSFLFKGIDLVNPKQVRYRWKLEGAEQDWSPLSAQNQVNYANLAPGKYRLWVQATSDGQVFSAPISAGFEVLKPFWQRWPFQAAALLAVAGLLFFGVRNYVQRVRRTERERREKLEVQNRLLQLEQKALQLQMNPHFLFNALNSIQSLIATQDYATARQEINQFAKLMRGILMNSRRQSISLEEETETLEQYLHIEQFCQQNSFTFALRVHPPLEAGEVEIPPMLLQPFVENAVVHGISHLGYPGHIALDFRLEGEMLVCTIEDNGVGREKAALLSEAKKPGHQSVAMQVTQERLEALGGTMSISDIRTKEGKIGGTKIELRLPVKVW